MSADTTFHPKWILTDTLAVAKRHLIGLFRDPRTLVFSTVQPVIFVLMFRYVFGGAVRVPGIRYVDFLMPGIFVQTVTFGGMNTGIGLAEDLHKGLIERFRSLPMARSAVLGGRALADVVRNVFVIILMLVVGFLVGFRVHTNAIAVVGACALLLLFGFALSWLMALVGLSAGTGEGTQAAAFPILALLVFASNAFVDPSTMPKWLAAYARHQPVSATVTAARALMNGGPTASHVVSAIIWIFALIAVFVPLAVMRYRARAA